MATLYSVIPGLVPDQQEILEAELLAKQLLEAKFPDLDLREGTGLRDLVLRPTGYAMALLRKASQYYFSNNTLRGTTADTPEDMVNDIMSNWFLERHIGTRAVISARLYFARTKNVTLGSNIFFSPDNSLRFFPITTTTYPASSLQYDPYTNEWFLDVILQAEAPGTEYNLGSGSLLYFANFDPYFLHAEIGYLSQPSQAGETNEEYIARAENAISTRNLVNNPSIISNLQAAFSVLDEILPVGYGHEDMIRDLIKVVIDPESPREPTSMERDGDTVTINLPQHNFNVGQKFNLTGAEPSDYDGSYQITEAGNSYFKFELPAGTPSYPIPSTLPMVQSYTAPTLAHTGGMVDVYCSYQPVTSIIQVTTDDVGMASITGPIFSLTRSEVSGGTEDDTIPMSRPISPSGTVNWANGTPTISITSLNHNLENGDLIRVAGLSQTMPIQSLFCVNFLVTVNCTNHPLTSGQIVRISGVNPVTYNGEFDVTVIDQNTFTYVAPVNIAVPGSADTSVPEGMTISNTYLDGEYPVTVTSVSNFMFDVGQAWVSPFTPTNSIGNMSIEQDIDFEPSQQNLFTVGLDSLEGEGYLALATKYNHGYQINRYVTIRGATPEEFNGTWRITRVPSIHQFEMTTLHPLPAAVATGDITCEATIPWKDWGFSTKQELFVNFGPAYANATASFEIKYFDYVEAVQEYLDSLDQHVLCADYLARGYNLYVIDVGVTTYGPMIPSTGAVSEALTAYLKTLPPGSILIISDLVGALTEAGVDNLQTPIDVKYSKYHRDLVPVETGTITDFLDPKDATNVFILGNVESFIIRLN